MLVPHLDVWPQCDAGLPFFRLAGCCLLPAGLRNCFDKRHSRYEQGGSSTSSMLLGTQQGNCSASLFFNSFYRNYRCSIKLYFGGAHAIKSFSLLQLAVDDRIQQAVI